ncbi:hypothetical protein [Bacillus sp. NEB1478]|uniref:hypothetical protein n=1 Tax=Bacillus sp. NEB1478 TaxID=3073816 RepID=UPI002872FAD4|nr:hypothetical protein [Bacillus sp. NEB1478]WNB91049.1 hypothetical protein RGB74_14190 [Bacillus sp. NEB1478]
MRKKSSLLSIISILFISVLLFVIHTIYVETEGRQYYFKNLQSTNLSKETINSIRLHENINSPAFERTYGNALGKDNNDMYDYFHWKTGLVTASLNKGKNRGEIVRLIISISDEGEKPVLETARGISVGAPKIKVLNKYGGHYYKRSEQGVEIIGYVDHTQKSTIEFWLDGKDRVFTIRFDDIKVK